MSSRIETEEDRERSVESVELRRESAKLVSLDGGEARVGLKPDMKSQKRPETPNGALTRLSHVGTKAWQTQGELYLTRLSRLSRVLSMPLESQHAV
jgi:hypothetical protein